MRLGRHLHTAILMALTFAIPGCGGNRYTIDFLTCKNRCDNTVDTLIDNVAIANCTLEDSNFFRSRLKNSVAAEWEYPREAFANCYEGISIISFTIRKDGSIANIKLVESSGIEILDNAALIALGKASPVDKPPSCVDNAINIEAKFCYDIQVITVR